MNSINLYLRQSNLVAIMTRRMFKTFVRRWVCEKDFNILRLTVYVMHHISFCFSPLNRDLVESSRKQVRLSVPPIAPNLDNYALNVQDHMVEGWTGFLLKPLKLAELIKRYHCAGDIFLLSMMLQLMIIAYGTFKTIFYQFYVGEDEILIDKFRDHFPRIFESYPNPADLYSTMTVSCSYCFVLRLMSVMNLVKMSIINKNQYNEISMTQLNVTFYRELSLPLRDWFGILIRARQHQDICNRRERHRGLEREAHLRYDPNMAIQLRTLDKHDLMYYRNMIDFSYCYEYFGYKLKRKRQCDQCAEGHGTEPDTGWFVPESNCRMDICECSYLVFTTLFLIPFFLVIMLVIMVEVILFELSHLTDNPSESTCMESLKQLPRLLTDSGRLMRVFDIYGLFAIQLPHQWSVTAVYIDLLALNSRIRKITETLEAICEYCAHKAHEYDQIYSDLTINEQTTGDRQNDDLFREGFMERHRFSYVPILVGSVDYRRLKSMRLQHFVQGKRNKKPAPTNMSHMERNELNYRIETILGLVRLLDLEFEQLKKTSSVFINILFTGGGFCAVLSITSMFMATPGITMIILACIMTSSVMPIMGVAPLCFGTERAVSIRCDDNNSSDS